MVIMYETVVMHDVGTSLSESLCVDQGDSNEKGHDTFPRDKTHKSIPRQTLTNAKQKRTLDSSLADRQKACDHR